MSYRSGTVSGEHFLIRFRSHNLHMKGLRLRTGRVESPLFLEKSAWVQRRKLLWVNTGICSPTKKEQPSTSRIFERMEPNI